MPSFPLEPGVPAWPAWPFIPGMPGGPTGSFRLLTALSMRLRFVAIPTSLSSSRFM